MALPGGAASRSSLTGWRCGRRAARVLSCAPVETHTCGELLSLQEKLQALAECCWGSTPASRFPLKRPAPIPWFTEDGIPGTGPTVGGREWHVLISVSAQAASPSAVWGRLVALHLLPQGSAVCTNTLDAESDLCFCFVIFLIHGFSRVHFRAGVAQTPGPSAGCSPGSYLWPCLQSVFFRL